MSKKAFVGISGGVDSAVSAALLQREGFDVTGVFIKIWQPTFFECTWEKDRLDAMRVAVALGVPFREIDLSDAYEKEVVRDMTESYAAGRTPNPDVECNEKIKFGAFYDWATSEGAEVVATGHYARIETVQGQAMLLKGIDAEKDQSYFLYRIPRAHLANVRFPVGGLHKSQVRALAQDFRLPVAQKKDSQGLCFVGDVSMADFLARYIDLKPGAVLNQRDEVVGEHAGAALYTIGQRHGFQVLSGDVHKPHYVTAVDAGANTVHVSSDVADCMRESAELDAAHQLREWKDGEVLLAQSRYRETPFEVTLRLDGEKVVATFRAPHIVSPGQSLVLYDGERCVGGGRIR